MQRLIIDTDPGVDDAPAILMAAAHPLAKIEAILAVGGNVGLEHTLRNALALTEIVGQDIPVYPGCDRPLVSFQEDAAIVHGSDGLGDVGIRPQTHQAQTEHAAKALVRLANDAPGEYTLVAIGPLTNVAVALKLDRDLPHKLKRFVIMGGAVTAHGNTSNVTAEFNIYYDPEAAHVVFDAWDKAGHLIEVVDWEITWRNMIPEDVLNRFEALGTPKAEIFQKISAKLVGWISEHMGQKMLFAADPLAMAVVLEPDIVTRSEKHHLSVEIAGTHTRGQTVVDWQDRLGKSANALIVLDVDRDRFFELMEQGLR
jgi:purine nucleosidase